jgi:hypothetical protein
MSDFGRPLKPFFLILDGFMMVYIFIRTLAYFAFLKTIKEIESHYPVNKYHLLSVSRRVC